MFLTQLTALNYNILSIFIATRWVGQDVHYSRTIAKHQHQKNQVSDFGQLKTIKCFSGTEHSQKQA